MDLFRKYHQVAKGVFVIKEQTAALASQAAAVLSLRINLS
jgi:hypothetical protein